MGRGQQGESYTIINEWGGVWVVPEQVRAVPEPKHVNLDVIFFRCVPNFPYFSLPQID
jgi:hypothetical protein